MYHTTRPLFITQELESEFQDYAVSKYPEEACAFIIDGTLVPVENISSDPCNTFELSSKDQLKVTKAQAFIHSHPDGDLDLSEHDFLSQKAAGIPYGICVTTYDGASRVCWYGDFLLDYPLLERSFISGAFDCFSLVRAIYKQEKNIVLPDFYREDDWWNNGGNVIEENIINSGFSYVDGPPQKYDVLAMSFKSSGLITHLAVYMGDSIILHHLEGLCSKTDYLVRYNRFVRGILRFNG